MPEVSLRLKTLKLKSLMKICYERGSLQNDGTILLECLKMKLHFQG